MMLPLHEFSLFAGLPTELRLLIWSFVPHPNRVIGLLPVASAGPNRPYHHDSDAENLPAYQFRLVVQPRRAAVFAPLHACREARTVWLSRLFKPERHLQIYACAADKSNIPHFIIQSDVPYINYETDIITIFDAWKARDFAGVPGYSLLANADNGGHIDPFSGLDRERVQHIGICEIPYGLEGTIQALKLQELSSLQRFSFITLGPDSLHNPENQQSSARNIDSPLLEMSVLDIQRLDCELKQIATEAVVTHPFWNQSRLRHANALSPAIRPLPRYAMYTRALLWHACLGNWAYDLDEPAMAAARWDFLDYVFEGAYDSDCPLPLASCGDKGHSRDEVLKWQSRFCIDYKFLGEGGWTRFLMDMNIIQEV